MSSDLITLNEAAELIGKNLRTIQRHVKSGKLKKHDVAGKSFISRAELVKKIGVSINTVAEKEAKPAKKPQKGSQEFRQEETADYQKKWAEELQKHAQTREELGVWKGRAEAYQAFSARLLGNGQVPDAQNLNSQTKPNPVTKSVKIYTYIIYAMIAVFLVIITIFFLLIFVIK